MGEGNRRIARALYERAGEREKKQASEFFENLGSKKDGKIRVREVRREIVLKEVDWNSDGFLDFNDGLVLFYYKVKKAITILQCCGCSKLIFGSSYSCFECLFNYADSRFALCRDCYGKGSVKHPHPLTSTTTTTPTPAELLRDQALLLKFSDLISTHQTSLPKGDMKKLWEDAKYKIGAASPALETMADNYLESMRSDNGLDLNKFSTLTKQQEAFLTPRPDSHPATNYMKNALAMKLKGYGPQPTPTEIHGAHTYTASPSTLQTHSVNSSTHPPNANASSNGISPLKVATTTFKIVEMALTIASLSSMCTIM